MTESDTQISPPADAPAPKPKRSGGRPLAATLLALIVAALVAAALVAWPLVERRLNESRDAPRIEALRQELAATRAQLAELASRPPLPSAAPAADADLERRLAGVEATIKAQPAATPHLAEEVKVLAEGVDQLRKTSADAAAVLRLADRLGKAETELRDLMARRSSAAAQLLAIGQLRAAVDLALPFDAEWRTVKALAPGDADVERVLAPLKPHAQSGIPTRPMLADRLAGLEPAIIRAEALPEGDSWWRRSLNRLMTLVTIRREDGQAEGDGAAALLARTRARLAVNDLAAAIAEAEHLNAGPAALAGPWLDQARARLDADRALSELTAQAVAAIGARQ